jgi:hypothetical protein
MEAQICNECIRDSGFEAFGTAFAGEEPIACDVCGGEFWKLNTAVFVGDSTYTQEYDTFTDADPGL